MAVGKTSPLTAQLMLRIRRDASSGGSATESLTPFIITGLVARRHVCMNATYINLKCIRVHRVVCRHSGLQKGYAAKTGGCLVHICIGEKSLAIPIRNATLPHASGFLWW